MASVSVAIVAVLCALLVYEWRAGRVRWWVPARRVVGFWGTLGGDLYEVRRAQSGGLELISSGETLPVSIRAPRQFCVGAPGAAPGGAPGAAPGGCGTVSLDGRSILWGAVDKKWVRQGVYA